MAGRVGAGATGGEDDGAASAWRHGSGGAGAVGLAEEAGEFARDRACWRVTGGYACRILAVLLMNQALFPLFDGVFTYTRDISILFSAACMFCVALLSMYRPRLVDGRLMNRAALACIPVAAALVLVALRLGSAPLLVFGAALATLCRTWSGMQADFSAVRLGLPRAGVCVALGSALAYLADALVMSLPAAVGVALDLLVLSPLVIFLCHGPAEDLLGEISASEPVAEVSVTRPTTFLPLTNNLFAFQFIMYVTLGFALRSGEIEGVPSFGTWMAFAMAVALCAYALWRRGDMSIDFLCNVALMFLFAALMFPIAGAQWASYLVNSMLVMVNSLYNVMITYTLLALAGRNRLTACAIFCWAGGLSSVGTTLGALAGTTGNALIASGASGGVSLLVGAVVLALLAYVLFGLRTFSFRDTIAGVTEPGPDRPAVVDAPDADEAFERRCRRIAQEAGLTPREAQVFSMLARGRNREYIEERIGVSRNTVKAHVKHVYAKLGIHSHQELIDLVEGHDG